MKKSLSFILFIFFICLVSVANAADVTLTWNPVNFEIVASDPAKSGYKLYKSLDDGDVKTEIGTVDMSQTTFSYQENTNAKFCYYATAFNQVGESAYSLPACGYISSQSPPVPEDLKVMLQKIVASIQEYLR